MKLLREEELEAMRAEVNRCDPEFARHRGTDFEALVSEVRSLRSDRARILAILWKSLDGPA